MKLYRSTVVIVAALFDLASAQLATAQIGDMCIKELSGIGTDTVDPGCGVDGPFQTFVFQSQKPGPLVVYLDEPSIGDGIRTYTNVSVEICCFGNNNTCIGINKSLLETNLITFSYFDLYRPRPSCMALITPRSRHAMATMVRIQLVTRITRKENSMG